MYNLESPSMKYRFLVGSYLVNISYPLLYFILEVPKVVPTMQAIMRLYLRVKRPISLASFSISLAPIQALATRRM